MDTESFNRDAWDRHVENGCEWTVPVTSEQVAAARLGEWQVILTATRPVPRCWFPADLRGVEVLGLASGGGQQGPILAAVGANITVFDNSPRQLAQDRLVAEREGLAIRTVQGNMADLSIFPSESFDLVFHPVSNVYIESVEPVWRECYRVLRSGGTLLAGLTQPHIYCLDLRDGVYHLRFSLPYSDRTSISPEERAERFGASTPLEFSHTLTDLLGGQLAAGFHLVDLYEDTDERDPLSRYMPLYMATRATKV
jgi:SAM-dependent methyltransferase